MRRWTVALLVASLGLVFGIGLVSGCDDDTPPPAQDTTKQDIGAHQDTVAPWPDLDQPPDQFVWPDQAPDTTIWPDSYTGAPFGCQSDADCFGQKCCTTPWGVKLCSTTCN